MNPDTGYSPPNSQIIASRQNDQEALRLLLVQRRLYGRSKRWLSLRAIGMLVIGFGAPLLAVVRPEVAVWCGAVAGLWYFLGRVLIMPRIARLTSQGACEQERFDQYVFQMPVATHRELALTPEQTEKWAGPSDEVQEKATKMRLKNWYDIDVSNKGAVSVALAQRANAAYSAELLRSATKLWFAIVLSWFVALTALSLVCGLTLQVFLVGVVLPVLPAALDARDYVMDMNRSGRNRDDLERSIRLALKGGLEPTPEQLMAWQSQLFDLRDSPPYVPDFLYRLQWRTNERAMRAATSDLGRKIRGDN